jgi:hypothetical protein
MTFEDDVNSQLNILVILVSIIFAVIVFSILMAGVGMFYYREALPEGRWIQRTLTDLPEKK